MTSTLRPSLAAWMAARRPAGPLPTTMRSYRSTFRPRITPMASDYTRARRCARRRTIIRSVWLRLSLAIVIVRLPPEHQCPQRPPHALAPPERCDDGLEGGERGHLQPVVTRIAARCRLRQPEFPQDGVGEIEAVHAEVERRLPGNRHR